jgi:hypothetical protein
LDLIFNRSFKNALRNVMEASLWRAIYGAKLDLDVEDHIRRRRLKAFMSRPSLMRRLIEDFLPAALQHVRSRQASSAMLSRSWDKAGLTNAITNPGSVSQETIVGTETWPTKFYMMKGLQDDPIDNIRAQDLRGFCRAAGLAGFSYQSVSELRSSVTDYMHENGLTLQHNEDNLWILPTLPGSGAAAASTATNPIPNADTFEEIEPISAKEFDGQDEEMEYDDWSWLEDGSGDEAVVPTAARRGKRKAARKS